INDSILISSNEEKEYKLKITDNTNLIIDNEYLSLNELILYYKSYYLPKNIFGADRNIDNIKVSIIRLNNYDDVEIEGNIDSDEIIVRKLVKVK
ncbi:MAG: hypothetical protein ACOCV8_02245, partial [Spirochaetota bacterium]